MIDPTKPVQLVDGRPVRILCTDYCGDDGETVLGLVKNKDGSEQIKTWSREGVHEFCPEYNLVNAPERHPHADLIIAWANGAKVEKLDRTDKWVLCRTPLWNLKTHYRIASTKR